MNEDSQRVGPMANPPHLGELIRESMEDVGWSVTETALRLRCERGTLSRLLNGKAGVSANMALALKTWMLNLLQLGDRAVLRFKRFLYL